MNVIVIGQLADTLAHAKRIIEKVNEQDPQFIKRVYPGFDSQLLVDIFIPSMLAALLVERLKLEKETD